MANNDYITTDCKLTISKDTAKLDEELFLYKNDKNIKLLIQIEDKKYRYKSDTPANLLSKYKASYAQVKWYKNAEVKKEFPIQATDDGKVVFIIEKELIDEDTELGDYDLQLRLLNENQESIRSLPIIKGAVHILKPLFETGDIATVNSAVADRSMLSLDGAPIDTYNSDGTYNQTNWGNGDIISSAKLNKLEKVAKDNVDKVNKIPAKSIVEGGKLYLAKADGTKLDAGTVLPAGGSVGNNVEPQDDDIPKVFFSGEKPTSKSSVHATIEYKSKTEHFKGYVDIKCQGTSSMAYPKKNYTIKMFTDSTMAKKVKKDFKGWGAQSKFCLKANYIDHSHARNICSAKLWNQIVASRANYALLPELLRTSPCNGAIDGFPIKVYYNNNYEGVYTWNIPKDKWMFNMDDTLDNHCVLCGEEYNSGCFLSANASLWSDEIHDAMPASIVTSFNAFQNFVISSTDDDFKTNLENYVYVDSLIDYYIFQYAICGLDSMGKNQLFATYDGTKWIATSYDMDSTFGLYWNGQSFVSATYRMQEDYESGKNGAANKLYVRLEKLFVNEIKTRYKQLRADILSYSNVVNTFEPFMDIIGNDLYAEDLTIYTGIPSGAGNNIKQIRDYYRDRLVYVDAQIAKLIAPGETAPCIKITLNRSALQLGANDKNYLDGVASAINGNDLFFNQITIPVGFYKFTNINGGTFKYLNYNLNNAGNEDNRDTTDPAYINCCSESNTLTVHGYPDNKAENTADKLALYKLVYTEVEGTEPIAFTQAGKGFLDPSTGNVVTNEYDVYSNTIELDSSKTYALKYIGDQQKSTEKLCIKKDSTILKVVKNVNNGDIITPFKNITSLAISCNTYEGDALANYTVIEVTESYETAQIVAAHLTATVEPANTTDSIVWSSSPEGIVTVNNGRVKAVSNGETVVTATCGTQSTTCNVTVSNLSDVPSINYELSEPLVCDGTSTYKDTGIQLLSSNNVDRDWTMLLEFTPAQLRADQYIVIVHCMKEADGYPGVNIDVGMSVRRVVVPNNKQIYTGPQPVINNPIRYALVKQGKSFKVYNEAGAVLGSVEPTEYITPVDQTLLLGAYQTVDGVKGRFFNGTINKFKLVEEIYTEPQIKQYFGIVDKPIAYTLPQETAFNGTTDYIDTGIRLFKTDQDFTITMDVTADTLISLQSSLVHCMKEQSPYPGINLQSSGADGYYALSAGSNVSIIRNLIPIGQRTKVVIVKNGTTMKVYNSNNINEQSVYNFTSIDQTLLLGAYQTVDGAKGRFFKGTIHAFSISNTVYTNEQINTYLGVNVATD